MISESYSLTLVILSIVVALVGASVAVEIAQRVRASEGRRRSRWAHTGALALALGVWATHFVGMLALQPSVPTWYDVLLIVASALAAVVAAAIAFFIFNRASAGVALISLAGFLMGGAIAGMYYAGMQGMRMGGSIVYDPAIVAVSVSLAVAFSLAALWATRRLLDIAPDRRVLVRRAGAAVLLAIPVV